MVFALIEATTQRGRFYARQCDFAQSPHCVNGYSNEFKCVFFLPRLSFPRNRHRAL